MPHRRHAAAAPVRPGADPGVILVMPIGEVVAALLAGTGVVGDFVGRQARGGGKFASEGEQVGRLVIVERNEIALADHRREAGAGFDRQLIEREVRSAETERLFELCLPLSRCLAGQGVNQVERYPREGVESGVQRSNAFFDSV